MPAPIETARRPTIERFLTAILLVISMACGEAKPVPPTSPGAPGEPLPSSYFELSGDLYLADSSGAILRRLTQGGWPSWSPDGRRIVFHRGGRVCVIGADGVNEVELALGQWPTWSPD